MFSSQASRLLGGLSVFSQCLCGFSPGPPASFHSPDMQMRLTGNPSLSLYVTKMSLKWVSWMLRWLQTSGTYISVCLILYFTWCLICWLKFPSCQCWRQALLFFFFSLRTCLQDNYNCGTWTASTSDVWRACLRIIDSWNGAVIHIAQYIVFAFLIGILTISSIHTLFFLYFVSCVIVLLLREDPKEACCDHNPSCCICSANLFFFYNSTRKRKPPTLKWRKCKL